MGDLGLYPEPLQLSRDDPARSFRVLAFKMRPEALEPAQGNKARIIMRPQPPRLALARRRRVLIQDQIKDDQLALVRVSRGGAPSQDQALRCKIGKVAHQRPRNLRQKGFQTRTDAFEHVDPGIDWKKTLRSHVATIDRAVNFAKQGPLKNLRSCHAS